ncbi:AMIN-like domain-containing (lipo)protein [Phycicoccus avicenniae]|uniref:AMIN-like domain-containing (lipo)protein n=1 Tax=Phycicoccus avicenniae TaxID=2828860 RepID=UPI003D26AF9D
MSSTSRTRRATIALAAAAALCTTSAVAAGPASAATCAVTWGSLAKTSAPMAGGRVAAVRAGTQTCFDRLVVDLTGPAPGYDVRYVTTVLAEGSGAPVPVAGGARLAVVVRTGATSVPAMPSVAGYPTFRQVRWAGSFEGQSTLALGVRARLPFRVFTLAGPGTGSRLVVDVAHSW